MSVNPEDLRKLSAAADAQRVQDARARELAEIERKRRHADEVLQNFRRSAENALAQLSDTLRQAAAAGDRETLVFALPREMLASVPKRYFLSDECKPDCLPDYARPIYDHCKEQGLRTIVQYVDPSGKYPIRKGTRTYYTLEIWVAW